MRLSAFEINGIKQIAHDVFGEEVRVTLFGSRTDDHKRGGDIDLLIDSSHKNDLTLENKIRFLVKLKSKIGEQKIDVLYKKNLKKPIVQEAMNTGIEL